MLKFQAIPAQGRIDAKAVIQKKDSLKLLQRLLYSKLNIQTACTCIEQNQYGYGDLLWSWLWD